MAYKDMREFMARLEEEGMLRRISVEVDWDKEIGAIAEEVTKKEGPSLLFENIKDYKDTHGKKVFTNPFGKRERICIALDVPKDYTFKDLVSYYRQKSQQRIKPILLSTGPVKEVIHRGPDVDLLEFPVPRLHARDGGRYIATWCIVITKDPDSDWVNWGMYRGMVSDKKTIACLWLGPRHGLMHGRKYHTKGEKVPVAIAMGVDPMMLMATVTDLAAGESECDLAGGLRGEPVDLVKCETVDLEVPATAEIVLEGTVDLDPKNFIPEGPFGEYPGYYSELGSVMRPAFTVNCITHRNDPILNPCSLGNASHYGLGDPENLLAITLSSVIWNRLEKEGVQGITGVWSPPEGIISNIFISIDKLYYGHAQWVASALWGLGFLGKLVVVVDSDIDVYDLRMINAALAFRFQAYRGLVVSQRHFAALDPSVDPELRAKAGDIGRWDVMLLDATWPIEWEPRKEWGGLKHPPACLAEKEDMEKVRERWGEYGLD